MINIPLTPAQEYGALKLQEKQIKERLAELQPTVLDLLQEQGGVLEVPSGKLSIRVNRNWNYPKYLVSKVQALKEEIAELQKTWQIKNTNKYKPKPTITFSS